MFIKYIEIENFRGIIKASFELHNRINVFIGKNGSGKSSILDFISIMIAQCRLLTKDAIEASQDNIMNEKEFYAGKLCCEYNKSYILSELTCSSHTLSSNYFENTSGSFSDKSNPHGAIWTLHENLKNDESSLSNNFPLVVFYPTNRAILDIPERIRGFKPAIGPLDALEGAMASALDFRSFTALFRRSEQEISNQLPLITNKYAEWHQKQVDSVNAAIHAIIPEFGNLHVEQKPFNVKITKNNRDFRFLQLSDGEKCLVAMIGDLAQRLAIANPLLKNPLEGSAVVLVDEIELHLHPEWQRMIIPSLLNTFPNCQFIVTSHSPQVLGEVKPESIWILEEGEAPYHPVRSLGMDSSELLTEVMEAESRSTTITKEIDKINVHIAKKEFDAARSGIKVLAQKTGNIPAIVGINTRLSILGEEQAEIGN